MGTGKLLGKPNKLRGNDLRWTSIPSRESRNTPGCYGPVGSKASFRKGDVLIIYFFVGDTDVK